MSETTNIALVQRLRDRRVTKLDAPHEMGSWGRRVREVGDPLCEEAADRIEELEGIVREAQAFRLEAQSREAEEARFYRYLRDEAGTGDDEDGPMICSGLGDNFDYLRGEECDAEIRAAIERKARAALGE